MKKLFILSFFIFSLFLMAGCGKEEIKATWQGSYYEHGLQENEIYGPVFTNYEACKEWALGKVVNSDDTVNCSKNCYDSLDGTPICEEVVRNWAPLPGSNTFDNYKEDK